MKKLLIAVAIICTAAASQAASITWSAMNVKTPIATDVKVDQTGIIGTGAAMENLAINLFWVDSTGTDVAIGTFYTGTGSNAGKSTNNVLGNGTSSDLYLAMVDDQGATWKPQYHMTATYSTEDGTYTFDGYVASSVAIGDLASKAVGAAANFTTAGTWTYTANAVPEPTSAMLVLLGVAGLALRRRRA